LGFRARKSMKVAPGVRLSVSKSGVGASVGGRGGRYSAHSSGRRTVSAGGGVVPGVSYQKSVGGGGSRSIGASPQAAPPSQKKPGLFAPKGEKQLYKAIKAQDVQWIKQVGVEHADFRLPSYSLAGLMMLTSEPEEAERLLGEAFGTGKDPAEDKQGKNGMLGRTWSGSWLRTRATRASASNWPSSSNFGMRASWPPSDRVTGSRAPRALAAHVTCSRLGGFLRPQRRRSESRRRTSRRRVSASGGMEACRGGSRRVSPRRHHDDRARRLGSRRGRPQRRT